MPRASIKLTRDTVIELTSRVCAAPKDDGAILILLHTENLVEVQSEAIQMSDVQWAEVMVKCVVQKSVIDGEVVGSRLGRHGLGAVGGSLTSFPRGQLGFRVGKDGVFGRGMDVRGEVQPLWKKS